MLQCSRCPYVVSLLYFAYYVLAVFTALQKNIFIDLNPVNSFLFSEIECQVPEISFGNQTEGNPPYSYQSKATFECWPGYRMKGFATSVCEESGWSALPACVEGKLNLLNAKMDGSFFPKVCIHDMSDK